MANTVIQLKKSGTPSSIPVSLANGELAINYADGKLFYKDSTGTIKTVSVDAYSTVNVGGTLLVADIPNDVISIGAGDNITLTPDALTDSFTVAANLKPAFDVANAGFNKANSANVLAKAAYDYANTITGGATISNTAPSTPSAGSFWWNTTYGRLFVYYNDGNTSQWVDATATATGAKVQTTTTAPTGSVDGQLWWNSEYGRLFVYYNDGDTSQWVDTNPATDIGGITDIANAAFDKANVGFVISNAAFDRANTAQIQALLYALAF